MQGHCVLFLWLTNRVSCTGSYPRALNVKEADLKGSAVLGCPEKDIDGFETPRSSNVYPVFLSFTVIIEGHAVGQLVEALRNEPKGRGSFSLT